MGGDKRTSFHEDWLFNQENVASLIFAASFAGWICVALWFVVGSTAAFTTSIVLFFIILILSKIILNSDVPRGDRPNVLPQSSIEISTIYLAHNKVNLNILEFSSH